MFFKYVTADRLTAHLVENGNHRLYLGFSSFLFFSSYLETAVVGVHIEIHKKSKDLNIFSFIFDKKIKLFNDKMIFKKLELY